MQVLEGSRASVNPCFSRILNDERHHSIKILIDRRIPVREFAGWTMLHRRKGDTANIYQLYVERLLSGTCDEVRAQFRSFLSTGSHANLKSAPVAGTIPLVTFVSGRFHWDDNRNGIVFEASGPGGPIRYIINPAALAELGNGDQVDLEAQQCIAIFRNFEHRIHRIAQRERRTFDGHLPLIVIRREDVRGE